MRSWDKEKGGREVGERVPQITVKSPKMLVSWESGILSTDGSFSSSRRSSAVFKDRRWLLEGLFDGWEASFSVENSSSLHGRSLADSSMAMAGGDPMHMANWQSRRNR